MLRGSAAHELRVGDAVVGRLRLRGRSRRAVGGAAARRDHADRVRGGARARARACVRGRAAAFLRAVLHRAGRRTAATSSRARPSWGVDVEDGAAVIVVRAHHFAPAEDDWRVRVLVAAERAARAAAPGSIAAIDAAQSDTAGQIVVLSPADGEDESRRAADAVARELRAALHGFTFAVGYSRVGARSGRSLPRRERGAARGQRRRGAPGGEEAVGPAVLAFEATGAYRLLLPAMSEDPGELQRFYAETVEPLVAYDEQYETDLVADARDVPGVRRQRRRHRAAAVHAPPHDPLPARARARPVRARRRLDRRAREARRSG